MSLRIGDDVMKTRTLLMQNNQLIMELKPIAPQTVPSNVSLALRSLYDSMNFEFAGRIDKSYNIRPGQFQYRWGVKVQPKDERLYANKRRTIYR
jgi:hypothetical protein